MKATLVCVSCGKPCTKTVTRCAGCSYPILHRITERFAIDAVMAVSPDIVTYKAVDRVLHRAAAVHLARPSAREAVKERLAREARLFREHEGAGLFPSFLTAGRTTESGSVFTAAEWVEGMTLSEAAGKARPGELLNLFLQAVDLIARVHALGTVVMNIRPEHFRITPEGEMRLADLKAGREPGVECHGLGVRGFKAPEQFAKLEPATKAMDVFALSAVLYVLLTGRFPYYGKRSSREPAWDKPLIPASTLNPIVPPDLDEILSRGLAISPERRFPDATALAEKLVTHYARRTRLDATPLVKTVDSPHVSGPAEVGEGIGKTETTPVATKTEPVGEVYRMPYVIPPPAPPRSYGSGSYSDGWGFVLGLVLGVVGTLLLLSLRGCNEDRYASSVVYTPAKTVQEVGESIVRVLSWPAAKVFANGKLLSEAPSLDNVHCPSGSTLFRIVSNTGQEHSFTTWLAPDHTYEIRTDLDNATHSVRESGQ